MLLAYSKNCFVAKSLLSSLICPVMVILIILDSEFAERTHASKAAGAGVKVVGCDFLEKTRGKATFRL